MPAWFARQAHGAWQDADVAPRFLTLADVAEILNISASQVYALVRNDELQAVKIGGRGQWRVEVDKLEEYIARLYTETADFVKSHPFTGDGSAESTTDGH